MAPMRLLRRVGALGAALLVASCAASGDAAPEAGASSSGAEDATLALAVHPTIPIEDEGLRQLAAMTGPVGDEGLIGSGCAAEPEAPLPDGDYLGIVLAYSTSLITIDVACVYGPDTTQYAAFAESEDAATQAYAVVNDVVEERPVLMTSDTRVYLEEEGWKPVDAAAAAPTLDPEAVQEHRCVWVRVEDGRAVALVEPATMGTAAS
ncbi:hypothetical protein [uncultured Demequina sp.]|uniref:hypothetical protein n=1 Tax=uncultured Demequina sp. TaxID=693499 RepID=UPI0025E56625|nr:hypothetical protein [uncultured Demequina sp.]